MDALEALHTRVSVAVLGEPGPSEEQVSQLLQAAVRAPDHGIVRPWRFLLLTGDDRKTLGALMRRARQQKVPESPVEELDKIESKPLRAPMVLVAVAEIDPDNRVPALEQIVSTGAAVQNILVAAHALGIGAIWRTGSLASDVLVKEGLGFQEKDEIVGFIYLGTPAGSIKRLADEDPVRYLRGLPE